MSSAKKFKDHYPREAEKASQKDTASQDKAVIQAYLKKIQELLKDPKNQKKSAEIISQLINSKKK